MFILNLTYCKPIAEVETYLAEHVAYLDKYYQTGKFICSGRKEPRIGGIIICRAHDRQEVE
ncbi:MAG: YciI family protein, partial [Selenomonadaceae bacterium]